MPKSPLKVVYRLDLPYPPSVNSYWRRKGSRYFIAAEGVKFRKDVEDECWMVNGKPLVPMTCKVALVIELFPPDNRERDIDNVLKALLDALQHAGVYDRDSRVKALNIDFDNPAIPGGGCQVTVMKL
jgi:crossover junction endodeoxyribonuclease RusA